MKKARAQGMVALEGLGLADRAESFPDQLSGGERQRVAIARPWWASAACSSPTNRQELGLRQWRSRDANDPVGVSRGVAAVVVTHDAKLASWADRVVFLRDGRAVDETLPPPSPEELLNPTPESGITMDDFRLRSERRPSEGGIPARRAVTHWAWRLFRREWRQQL